MMGAAIPMAFTDTAGRFLFPRLAWGRYRVGAEKLSENYPDVANPIYRSDGIAPLVVLSPRRPAAKVAVRLGLKAARVFGRITNAATGVPVSTAGFTIRPLTGNDWLSKSVWPDYYVLIPPNQRVMLTVSAPHYQPTTRVVWLRPGASLHFDVRLQPEPQP